jgi:5-methyltetrahydrofolate--homocysteine methyltransferase
MEEELLKISEAVKTGDAEQAVELAQEALRAGIDPVRIINEALSKALKEVGELFERGEYFLPDMIAGAQAATSVSAILQQQIIQQGRKTEGIGRVLIGTVQGDIHSIGKDIVSIMMRAAGFEVIDLGVDVSAQRFLEKVGEARPHLVGMSALLTSTMDVQREVIDRLEESGLRSNVKVMVGGAPVTESWAKQIRADAYAADAVDAIRKTKLMMLQTDKN